MRVGFLSEAAVWEASPKAYGDGLRERANLHTQKPMRALPLHDTTQVKNNGKVTDQQSKLASLKRCVQLKTDSNLVETQDVILRYPKSNPTLLTRSSLVASLAVASLQIEPISGGCGTFARKRASDTVQYNHQGARFLKIVRLMSTHLLLDLQLIDDRRQLRKDLVGLLVVFELGSDELGKVAEGLRCVKDLHWISA